MTFHSGRVFALPSFVAAASAASASSLKTAAGYILVCVDPGRARAALDRLFLDYGRAGRTLDPTRYERTSPVFRLRSSRKVARPRLTQFRLAWLKCCGAPPALKGGSRVAAPAAAMDRGSCRAARALQRVSRVAATAYKTAASTKCEGNKGLRSARAWADRSRRSRRCGLRRWKVPRGRQLGMLLGRARPAPPVDEPA